MTTSHPPETANGERERDQEANLRSTESGPFGRWYVTQAVTIDSGPRGNRDADLQFAAWCARAALSQSPVAVGAKTSTDGSLTVDEAVAGILDLYPGAHRQALRCLAELMAKPPAQVTPVEEREAKAEGCTYCNDTGDVHGFDGEWRGICHCAFGKALDARRTAAHPAQSPAVGEQPVPEALLKALRFYAQGEHYTVEDDDFDSVSGEPPNILCHTDLPIMIEDGAIARAALRGIPVAWVSEGEDATPEPLPGEVYCCAAAPPPAAGAEQAWDAKDSERLDWLMHRLSGKELRRVGIETSAGGPMWTRVAIDAAMVEEQKL